MSRRVVEGDFGWGGDEVEEAAMQHLKGCTQPICIEGARVREDYHYKQWMCGPAPEREAMARVIINWQRSITEKLQNGNIGS